MTAPDPAYAALWLSEMWRTVPEVPREERAVARALSSAHLVGNSGENRTERDERHARG